MTAGAAVALADSGSETAPLARFPRQQAHRNALRAWKEIVPHLRAVKMLALLLDFDGTLTPIRRRPQDVRCSKRMRVLLQRLARLPHLWLGIISGRRSGFLARRIAVAGIHYWGVYGAETDGRPPALSESTRRALVRVREPLERSFQKLPGVWIEIKGLSFVVHFRGARAPAVAAAWRALRRALRAAGRPLRILKGNKTWECVPRGIPGKGAAVSAVMRTLPPGSVGVYIGDDAADEEAFRALPQGITIRVGRCSNSRARYFLRGPGEVRQWLVRLLGEIT